MDLWSRSRVVAMLVVFLGFTHSAFAEPTLTLPLAEYERMNERKEEPALTVVDQLRISGSFKNKDLALTLSGRTTGRKTAVAVLEGASNVRVYGCEGDGLLSRADNGAFELTPLAPKFNVRCRIAAAGSDRLALNASASVLWVESSISDGEMIANDQGNGGWSLSVVRNVGAGDTKPADLVPPTAIGRYLVSLHPDETRFRYQLDVRNPNRIRQPFDVTIGKGDHVQQVDAQVSYDVEDSRYRFDLPPGETTIVLTGTLADNTFQPPVTASVQYVLLESHPLLRLTVEKAAKRISPKETGLSAHFRGAQAFLIGKEDQLSWKTSKLDTMHTTGFALNRADHTFFISPEGKVVAESTLGIDNQGASDIALPMKEAEPRFAGINNDPVLLTKNTEGNLWLPLYQGAQQLVVQFDEKLSSRFGFLTGELWLPQIAAPASNSNIHLRYSGAWIPLYERFGTELRLWEPDGETQSMAAMATIWVFLALGAFQLTRRWRIAVALAAGVASLCTPMAALLVFLSNLTITGLWIIPRFSRRMGVFAGTMAAGALGVFVVYTAITGFGQAARSSFGSSTASLAGDSNIQGRVKNGYSQEYTGVKNLRNFGANNDGSPSPVDNADGRSDDADGLTAAGGFQGLPARIQLPTGARVTTFQRELLSTQTPRAARVILISAARASQLAAVITLLAVLLIASRYRALRDGFMQLLEEAQSALKKPEPEAAPTVS